MSTPMTPTQTLAAFKAEGITVREYPGWRDRCRCHTGSHEKGVGWAGRGWGDVVGQVAHITAGDLGKRTVETYIRDIINGDPNTPTKSQTVIAPNGDVWLNSAGRCNHAGKVGGTVKAHMRAADFSTSNDYDDRFRGASVDGNAFAYGDECISSKTMTAAQRASLVKVHAARARFHGWSGRESVGHGEISSARYKVDPGLDMGKFRRDVIARLAGKPSTTPTKPAEPTVPVTPPTAVLSSSVLVVSAASKRSDAEVGGPWTKRRPTLAREVLESEASFVVVTELYSGQRPGFAAAVSSKYGVAGYREGRVLLYRKGRWATAASWWDKALRATGLKRKPTITDRFYRVDAPKVRLTVNAVHTSFETTPAGGRARVAEIKALTSWLRGYFVGKGWGPVISAGDFNAPAGATTRTDDAGDAMVAGGFHDLGMQAGAKTGRGRYHLLRVFGPSTVRGTKVTTVPTTASDHALTFVQFEEIR